MKKIWSFLLIGVLLFVMIAGLAQAEDKKPAPDIVPTKVRVKYNDNDNFAKYDGLLVRVNNKEDLFFSHNYFISLNDMKDLCKKFNVKCKYDEAGKKFIIGDDEMDLLKAGPTREDSFVFGKMFYTVYKGKPYFDIWGVYGGLGCSSISNLNDGVMLYKPDDKE